MKHSADTCLRMIEIIEGLNAHDEKSDGHNNFIRMVVNKERHAQIVKREIYILWSDYFKPEHLEKFPDLHDKLWKTAKQASKVKQTLSREETEKLVSMVGEVADIFAESKK
jgi:nickel superoxide dismutase